MEALSLVMIFARQTWLRFFEWRGRVSEVVNGKRALRKNHAKVLGEFFKVAAVAIYFGTAGLSVDCHSGDLL